MKANDIQSPDYKANKLGYAYLSDAEVLSLIIGGNKAVPCAQLLVNEVEGDYKKLLSLTVEELVMLGLTRSQALKLSASKEFVQRAQRQESLQSFKITCSDDMFKLLTPFNGDAPREQFYAIYLNRSNTVMKVALISTGTVSGTMIDVKHILKYAILLDASGLIISHNHPSGNLQPSDSDIKITQKIKEVCANMEVQLLDHVIMTSKQYYSFADNGIL
jgi:DNA repair protein RadC